MKNNQRPRRSFKDRLIGFMYGRNGSDTLGIAFFVLYFVLFFINIFTRSLILFFIELAIIVYVFFRMMSRNVYRRQAENRWFCSIGRKIKGRFSLFKSEWRDRKTHVYYKCPHCKKTLRLPKIKGKHTVNCPLCHNRFDIKV